MYEEKDTEMEVLVLGWTILLRIPIPSGSNIITIHANSTSYQIYLLKGLLQLDG
jgi:hypothetical protein